MSGSFPSNGLAKRRAGLAFARVAQWRVVANLLELDSLLVTTTQGLDLTQDVHCVVVNADGDLVATARDRASTTRTFARAFGFLSRYSRYEWDVTDSQGNRMLDVVKSKERTRGPNPTVSLVDGTPVGRAVWGGFGGIRPITLQGPGGDSVGSLEPALGQGAKDLSRVLFYRIHGADGAVMGEVLHRTGDPWGFELAFEPGAELTTRALSIAVALCLMQVRLTGAGT
jgi:hypothetical protein